MIDNNYTDIGTVFLSVVFGMVSILLGLKRLIKHWEKEGLEIEKINTEESLIKSLRTESERMSSQNQRLMDQLLTLQLQIGELHQSISRLRSENDNLHRQIESLNNDMKVIVK